MIVLLGLLCILWGEQGRCLEEDGGGFAFDGDIRHFSVANNTVYIATEEKLYQLSHDLTLIHSLTLRGILMPSKDPRNNKFDRVSEKTFWNATFSINLLLPFVKNGAQIICGVTDNECGYCEVLDLKNISNLLYKEHVQVGPLRRNSSFVGILVDVKKNPSQTETYILTAMQPEKSKCSSDAETINLQNSNNKDEAGIFSLTDGSSGTPTIKNKSDVEFVDGFQISSIIYLLSNVRSDANSNKVRLIWLEGERSKTRTLKSLRGATLSVSDGEGSRLLASSVIPGGQTVLWSGVFSVDGEQSNTELVVFDISPDLSLDKDKDPDFYYVDSPNKNQPETLKPEAVLFRQPYMTSVLAVRQKTWMVFFIGTGDGQLIKLAVDRNYHPACPKVLYRASDDRQVFPKIQLDPVDQKHVYVPFRNQMKRVSVSKCSTYTNVQECLSTQDPYCVWCGSKQRCTFEDDCQDSDWLSIPDDSTEKIISHKVLKNPSGEITLKIQTHLTVNWTEDNFACEIFAPSRERCPQNSRPLFPQCTCNLSHGSIPADGLDVTVKMRLGKTNLSERLKLTNCSDISGPPTSVLCHQCIKAGCGWNINGCSWSNEGVDNDSVCQKLEPGMNFSKPEISSISPSVVSFYGRNHALLSGQNLINVTRVRIQTDLDCSPQESPVWNKTGVSLTFHIATTEKKGFVKACVLLPDGSCHGNAKITYRSTPSCTDIVPSSTWASGKRKVTLMGSHLEFVEGITHSHGQTEVQLPTTSSSQKLSYDTPAALRPQTTSSSTVYLKVANQSLACSTKITYYPDPVFTSFSFTRTGDGFRVTIQKKADKLEMKSSELSVSGVQDGKKYACVMEEIETNNETDFFTCHIQSTSSFTFQHIEIKYGGQTVLLGPLPVVHQVLLIVGLVLIPCVIGVLVFIYRWQRRRTAEMNML
ncbi:plexin-C1-like isoform X2 [Mugil cephalus]|uniref:plexin-C1-like isoform X2 n=1 Tax=Mugil cephalus TaxID=48193 RepID=UPI001FB684CD|nr:plexin-C1-like isoform X2 [Mugil cephalus]